MGPKETLDRTSVDTKMKQIKKRRPTNIFKVALFMMRKGKSSKASVHADLATKSLWKKLFGSTKTLRLENKSAPHPTTKAAAIVPEDDHKQSPAKETIALVDVKPAFVNGDVKVEEKEKEIVLHAETDNPQSSPPRASSASDNEESCYASAMNLRELDVCNEDKEEENSKAEDNGDDEDCHFDDSAGDSMIDIKAEMFIAQFYEQMRLQNTVTQKIRG